MVSAVLFIFMSILLVYSAGSGANRVQVVLSGFSVDRYIFQAKTLCRHGCMYFFAALLLFAFRDLWKEMG